MNRQDAGVLAVDFPSRIAMTTLDQPRPAQKRNRQDAKDAKKERMR